MKTKTSVYGFTLNVDEDNESLFSVNTVKDKELVTIDRLNDMYMEYIAEPSILETKEFFEEFMEMLSVATNFDLKSFLLGQAGANKNVTGLISITMELILGSKIGNKRRIPLPIYEDILRNGINDTSKDLTPEIKKLIRDEDADVIVTSWILQLGLEDLFVFFYLALAGVNKEINSKGDQDGKKYKFDGS